MIDMIAYAVFKIASEFLFRRHYLFVQSSVQMWIDPCIHNRGTQDGIKMGLEKMYFDGRVRFTMWT